MRVALVHDWLTGMRGGERCLEVFCELFPDADLYTLVHVKGSVSPLIEERRIVTSFIQRIPGAARRFRAWLPLFPSAIERFDFHGYDLVLSSSHCVAKGARTPPGVLHVCYCFTPMRYVWDLYDDYVASRGRTLRALGRPLAGALRAWDRSSSRRVHHFLAISHHVAERIERCYGRAAEVIHPPVDTHRFEVSEEPGDYYLVVSALVPYKRVDLAVDACRRFGRRLVVVGTGPEERRLRRIAGSGVEFLGWRSDAEVAALYRSCRALLFPGREDFGIVPLEAMAAGRPVIAFGAGGALETVVSLDDGDEPTGVFFVEQSVDALIAALRRFETVADRFVPKALRARADGFDRQHFKKRIAAYLEARLGEARPC